MSEARGIHYGALRTTRNLQAFRALSSTSLMGLGVQDGQETKAAALGRGQYRCPWCPVRICVRMSTECEPRQVVWC